MLRVYNTLSKQKEEFKPVRPGKVGIYLCGPTVYKPSHIGHMVGPVIFDAIKRYLAYNGYDVDFVINITDVDDKLIAEATARNMPMAAVAEEMTADYMRNLEAMGVKESVTSFPKATEHICNIIRFTQDLIDKGFAYESEGDVYFDVGKFPEYGKLSHRTLESMQGEGGGTADRKRTPFDFALWKTAKPGEPSWDSPWGKGRPGWHIECSVMSRELLGETFDIHGGGLDLVFPHHENEVAQSEARHGCPMCNFWMHNGLMQASSETGKLGGRKTRSTDGAAEEGNLESQEAGKISKSKGSSAFSEMLKQFEPETIRFFLLSTHYRRPIDFSNERIEEVGKGLESFYRFFKRFEKIMMLYANEAQNLSQYDKELLVKEATQKIKGNNFYTLEIAKILISSELSDREKDDKLCEEIHAVFIKQTHEEFQDFTPAGQAIEFRNGFLSLMDDDFNTGGAIGILYQYLNLLNAEANEIEIGHISGFKHKLSFIYQTYIFKRLCLTLGLFREPPKESESAGSNELVGQLMELLIELRTNAKKAKDFAAADLIRNRLKELGVVLEDRPGGTEWSLASH